MPPQLQFGIEQWEHLQLFANTLTRYDHAAPSLVLQQLSDKNSQFKKIVSIPVAELGDYYADVIVPANREGFYTNAALNEMQPDESGVVKRRKNYVVRIRGQVVDVDQFVEPAKLEEMIDAMSPSMVVATSSNEAGIKAHFYFLYAEGDEPRIEDYAAHQLIWAYEFEDTFGVKVDRKLSPSDAFRVPGCYHQKTDDAFLTRVIHCEPNTYLTTYDRESQEQALTRYDEEKRAKKEAGNARGPKGGNGSSLAQDKLQSAYPSSCEGARNATLYEYAYQRLFCAKQLTRNEALGAALLENNENNEPPLEEQEVVDVVDSAFRNWKESFEASALEVMQKVSGQTAYELIKESSARAEKKYRTAVADGKGVNDKLDDEPDSLDANSSEGPGAATYDYSNRLHFTALHSDDAILARIAQKHRSRIMCNASLGAYVYEQSSGTWRKDEGGFQDIVRSVSSEMINEPFLYNYFQTGEGKFSKSKFDSYFKDLGSVTKKRQLLEGALTFKDFQFTITELDTRLDIINARNGVIDLKTGKLLPHKAEYKITKSLTCDYDEASMPQLSSLQDWKDHSLWTRVISEIMLDDLEMCEFMQRFLGYILLGGNNLQILGFLYGRGANGKSVIVETLGKLFGSYYCDLPVEFLMHSRDGESSPAKHSALAQIQGCRLITTSELDEGRRWSESTIKDLTGNDNITAKFMGKDMFTFRPQGTLIVRGNNKPQITGTDDGIWRRFLTIAFEARFTGTNRDSDLFRKLEDRSAVQGILAWLVKGALLYKARGLAEPEKVRAFKKAYRAEMNPLEAFFTECFEMVPVEEGTGFGDIMNVYAVWSKMNGGVFYERPNFLLAIQKCGLEPVSQEIENGQHVKVYPCKVRDEWKLSGTSGLKTPRASVGQALALASSR